MKRYETFNKIEELLRSAIDGLREAKKFDSEYEVAEVGSAMLCANFGVDTAKAFRNSIAYLQSWVSNLKGDPKAIVFAASRAEKAARFILGERTVETVTI